MVPTQKRGGKTDKVRKDVTLSELGKLISSAFPQVSKPNTRIAFRLLYTDSFRPRVLLKDVGTVTISSTTQPPSSSESEDAGSRTLDDVKYVIGDWIDVAIFNNAQGAPMGGGRFEGPRGPGGGGFSRGGGPGDRGRGRGDSYRGTGGRGRVGGGRNGFDGPRGDRDGPGGRDRDGPSRDKEGEGDERGPP